MIFKRKILINKEDFENVVFDAESNAMNDVFKYEAEAERYKGNIKKILDRINQGEDVPDIEAELNLNIELYLNMKEIVNDAKKASEYYEKLIEKYLR